MHLQGNTYIPEHHQRNRKFTATAATQLAPALESLGAKKPRRNKKINNVAERAGALRQTSLHQNLHRFCWDTP